MGAALLFRLASGGVFREGSKRRRCQSVFKITPGRSSREARTDSLHERKQQENSLINQLSARSSSRNDSNSSSSLLRALILAVSAQLHGARAQEREVVVDSTVQEKNVTYPVDTKQYRKIIMRCWKLSDKSGIRLRRRYRKGVRACIMAQRLRKDPRRRKAARRGHRICVLFSGALIRELERKLPEALREEQGENFTLYRLVLAQKPQDTNKIYSLHEPHIYCVAKGKEHKKYEFGTKASVAMRPHAHRGRSLRGPHERRNLNSR